MPGGKLGITRAQTPIEELETEFVTFHDLRKIIDTLEPHPKFPQLKYLIKISYLFGLRFGEILSQYRLRGRDFSHEVINGREALVVTGPTAKRGWKPRVVAVPLNPSYEPWSKEILDFAEDHYNEILFTRDISGVGRWLRNRTFERYTYFQSGAIRDNIYQEPKLKRVTPSDFRDIRACELALLHGFTQFDIMNYLGLVARPDYLSYFNKLLDRRDIFSEKDIVESLKLNYLIFNPVETDKYDFSTYMRLTKLIKKGLISVEHAEINIRSLPLPTSIGKDRIHHRTLKANGAKLLEELGSKNVTYEVANLDVYSYDTGIAIECGNSNGSKLIDFFYKFYPDLTSYREFWVLEYFNENFISKTHKFIIT